MNPTSGDNQAQFIKAYDELADAIFRHCYFRVYDREKARDLVQDCFMKTWDYLCRGGEIGNIKAFLYRTATNLAIDAGRRHQTDSLEALLEQGFDPTGASGSAEQLAETARVVAAIDRLKPAFRDVLKHRFLEGLGPQEIARLSGLSENVVSVRINRAVATLKKEFTLDKTRYGRSAE
ncbi:MAG: RNA polymerase sigma factor [Patescibacteria group bacterium]|jgi:RNA polymerase sigma-70 factor (ECF subfamily)